MGPAHLSTKRNIKIMKTETPTSPVKRVPADAATHLAFDRTCLAHERTMMAWVRTSVSLIGFGFSIYKFFSFMVEKGDVTLHDEAILGPRRLGMLMIIIGEIVLVVAAIRHHSDLKELDRRFPDQYTPPRSIAAIVSFAMAIMGILALIAVVARQ